MQEGNQERNRDALLFGYQTWIVLDRVREIEVLIEERYFKGLKKGRSRKMLSSQAWIALDVFFQAGQSQYVKARSIQSSWNTAYSHYLWVPGSMLALLWNFIDFFLWKFNFLFLNSLLPDSSYIYYNLILIFL